MTSSTMKVYSNKTTKVITLEVIGLGEILMSFVEAKDVAAAILLAVNEVKGQK